MIGTCKKCNINKEVRVTFGICNDCMNEEVKRVRQRDIEEN